MRRILFVFLAILFVPAAYSAPLVGVDGSPDSALSLSPTQALAVAWQFNVAYSDVQIRANLRNDSLDEVPDQTFTAYLTYVIGPGATDFNELARYSGTLDPLSNGWVTLFGGLTLPVGTYYLVIGSDVADSWLGWNSAYYPSALYETLPDAVLGDGIGYQWWGDPSLPADPAYAPSWVSYVSDPQTDGYLLFDVSTPEPATALLILLGLPVLVHFGRRRLTK